MVIAKDIPTDLWHKIIDGLMAHHWKITYQYDGIDAGIDYDCIRFTHGSEEIVLEWTNWEEGEITCTPERLKEIEKLILHTFVRVERADSAKPGTPPAHRPNHPD